jgi:anti-anti-sigma factor
MATAQGVIRYSQQGTTLTFRAEGRATMTQSVPLRRLAERALEGGTTQLRIDLRDCTHMDSTFLGTLLALKKTLDRRQGQVLLLTPSSACERILQQMGLGDVLPIEITEIDSQTNWSDLACDQSDTHLLKSNIAQAHQELAALPGPAGEEFKAVIRCMTEAEEKARAAGNPISRPSE